MTNLEEKKRPMTNLDTIFKSYDQPRHHIQKQGHYLASKGLSSQSYSFSSSQVWMWELHYKESWAPKNWCLWTMVMEKSLESPLDCKEIIHSILKEISPKYSLEGLVLKLKLQYLATLVKNWLTRKDPDAGKEWRQEEKGMAEDEMVGWHHWLDGHDFEQDLVVGDGQGNLVCCSPWGQTQLSD